MRVGAEFLGVVGRERQVRGTLEHHGDLGDPAAESLPGAQVERDPGPTPGFPRETLMAAKVSVRESGGCRPRRGSRRPRCRPASRRRTARGRWPPEVSWAARPPPAPWPSRPADRLRVERARLLHGGEGQQLQQMVLDDVPGRADAVVVAGPAADPDVLGHGDLHVVDVVAVPDRLVQLVGEPQRQQVLDRLLAEVVVDAEHRLSAGNTELTRPLSFCADSEVVAERLLDHHPPPLVARGSQPAPTGSSCSQTSGNAPGGIEK